MQKHNVSLNVQKHCQSVANIALTIFRSLHQKEDSLAEEELVYTGGLLHDIGRSRTHKIDHGVVGGKILRAEGYPIHARIAEVHVLGGITRNEAKKLNLPEEDFLPQTLIEKIVTYSDKRVKGDQLVSINDKWNPWVLRHGSSELLNIGYTRIRSIEDELRNLGAKLP